MVSVFSPNKAHLEEPGSGDYPDIWAPPTNANFTVIDACFGGATSLNLTGLSGIIVLSTVQAQVLRILCTGTQSGAITIQTPATVGGFWIVDNESAGAVTVSTAPAGAGVSVPTLSTMTVVSDGINTESATDSYLLLSGGTMLGALNLPSNGLNVGSGQLVVSGGNVTTSGSITATGDITAFSDAKFKEEIHTIRDALELVKRMRGVTFRWKEKNDNKRHAGVIAQEMLEVFPEVVMESMQENKSLYVAYGNICAVLIEAIKELNRKVESLIKSG